MYVDKENIRGYLTGVLTDMGAVGDSVMSVKCNASKGLVRAVRENRAARVFVIEACEHHHYAVENLHGVRPIMKAQFEVEDGDERTRMYYYVMQRGF
jgi:hypothetical protein